MPFKSPDDPRPRGEYLRHFFKFLATFTLIIGISLFLFSFTAGA
jgi:hypothetical protein